MANYTLITGASSGIGKAFSEFYAKEKKNLVLVARSKAKLETMKAEFAKKYNSEVEIFCVDLTASNSAKEIYELIQKADIFVETLINCAGFGLSGKVGELSYEAQHNEITLNVTSLFDMSKLFLDPMLKANNGTIINVGSTSAYHPIPTMAVYAASKAFVLSFTEALAIECLDTNVKILAISPGATDTNFFSSGGGVSYGTLRTPEHVVQVAIEALANNKISKIDGRNNYFTSTVLPRLLPRKKMVRMVYNIMKKQME